MATAAQVKGFINMIAPIAQRQAIKHQNKIFPSVCIAQACCESAYGTSPKMKNANAVFGIKVGSSKYHFGTAWKDKAYSTSTKECYDGKTYTNIVDLFRAYDTIEDAVEDYFDLLCVASRYKYALNQPTPLACITGIQKAPYATSPTYINTIMSIIRTYDLTKYDNGQVVLPETNEVSVPNNKPNYVVGKVYTTTQDLNIREQPFGTKMKYECITQDGKKHAFFDTYGNAILKKGTKVTCRAISKQATSTWILIPSGWICANNSKETYIV